MVLPESGCVVCGADLVYLDETDDIHCVYCGKIQETSVQCIRGHFVCDACHRCTGENLIERYCSASEETDPVTMAIFLMGNPVIRMHGPEHHFLVPAVLLASVYNQLREEGKKDAALRKARQRAERIPGGICGLMGDCGAAVGTGIFMSVFTGASPVSAREWQLSNLITAESLQRIALAGGPRCCKRNTFLALQVAILFLQRHFGIFLPSAKVRCRFSSANRECRKEECPFFPGDEREGT